MNTREKICIWLFDKSKLPYAKHFKKNKQEWTVTRETLLSYPNGTLGFEMGSFLFSKDFEMIPKLERHDAYHVITGIGTDVADEIALQFFFLGNDKRSLYLFGVVILGALLMPEFYYKYFSAFYKGKYANPLYPMDIEAMLFENLSDIQSQIFTHSLHYQHN